MDEKRTIADQEVFDWLRAHEKEPGFPTDDHWRHALERALVPFEGGEKENGRLLGLLLELTRVPIPKFVRRTLAANFNGWPGELDKVPHLVYYVPENFCKKIMNRQTRDIPKLKTMCAHVKNGDGVIEAATKTAYEYSHKDPKMILNIWKNSEYFPMKLTLLNPEWHSDIPIPRNKK
jgi:hypothetical protein